MPDGVDTYNGNTVGAGAAPLTHLITGVDHDGDAGEADATEPVTVTVPSAVAAWWDGLRDAQ